MRTKASDGKCVQQLKGWSTVMATFSADNSGAIKVRDWNSIGNNPGSAYVGY